MLKAFIKDESGQGLSEYILIVALIALAAILAMTAFRGSLGKLFDKAGKCIDSVMGSTLDC